METLPNTRRSLSARTQQRSAEAQTSTHPVTDPCSKYLTWQQAATASATAAPTPKDIDYKVDLPAFPPEVRNHIYHYIILDSIKAHVDCKQPPAMLKVSRQVREEFSSLYYRREIFNVQILQCKGDDDHDGRCTWRAIDDAKVIKALLQVPAKEQSLQFRQLFGSNKAVGLKPFLGSSGEVMPPSAGDEEQAKLWAHRRRWDGVGLGLRGILVLPKRSGRPPRYVFESTWWTVQPGRVGTMPKVDDHQERGKGKGKAKLFGYYPAK